VETPQLSELFRGTRPRVIVAIPAYNEEQFIAEIVRKAREFGDEVVVVDDGSCDGTSEAAKAAKALVINHGTNKGYGESIRTCFEVMKQKSADVLVILDGDGQHDPGDIPSLLAPIFRGEADMVIGSRFLSRRSNIPRYREFGINVITFLYNIGSQVKVSDAQSGLRAYSKKVVDSLLISESGMGASVEVIINVRDRGFAIKEVPIYCTYHHISHSPNPVIHGLGVALTVLKLRVKNLFRKLIGGSWFSKQKYHK
jgi:glycosyltransferase involved in cell wall biosynthesis